MSDNLPEKLDFKGKLANIPVWVWGAIAGVVLLVGYMFIKNRSSSNTAATSSTGLTTDTYQTSGLGGATNAQTTDTSTLVPDDNTSWLSRVSAQVARVMAASPSDVYAGLQKWLSGQTISKTEQGYVDRALSVGGTPPNGTVGISTVTPDPTDATKTPDPGNKPPVTTPVKVAPVKTSVPFGDGYVAATSPSGTQWFVNLSTGRRRALSKSEVTKARAAGYNYTVTPMSRQHLDKIPIGS